MEKHNTLAELLNYVNHPEHFEKSSDYFVRQWSETQDRHEAYKNFCRKSNTRLAAPKTVRAWFGIGGKGKPNRNRMIQIAFATQMTPDEANGYLTNALRENSLFVTDYKEMIYLYGLEHQMSLHECEKMIDVFEFHLHKEQVIVQQTNTDRMRTNYSHCHTKPPEEFVQCMCEHAGEFKGYSKTALNYLIEYKKEILDFVRNDARESLDVSLNELDYDAWAYTQDIPEGEEAVYIYRFLNNIVRRKNGNLSHENYRNLMDLYWVCYSSEDKNTELLGELYASALDGESRKKRIRSRNDFLLPDGVHFMSDKRLSELLGIAQKKERLLQLSQQLAQTTVPHERKKLEYERKQNARWCSLVSRDDLLPLIHYVAQRRYADYMNEQSLPYEQDQALGEFVKLAEITLTTCQMMPLNMKYELDYLLVSSYMQDECYSFSDIIEMSHK